MPERESPRVRVGVSACLLGQEVRYDGGHKRDAFLMETLAPFVEWVPVCPEVEIGLGIPRDPIRLVGDPRTPRLVVETTGEDLTALMQRYAASKVRELHALALSGYVLKRGSPSCGFFRVPVHRENGTPSRRGGRGLFASAVAARFVALPIEEEGRLADPAIREHFVERVFATARWRAFLASRPQVRELLAFHAAQELAILAHSPAHWARLGRVVARTGRALTRETLEAYGTVLLEALAVRPTRARHASVLRRLADAIAPRLDAGSRAELAERIQAYRGGRVARVVPLALVSHHVRRLGVADLADQAYLQPSPTALMLAAHAARMR